MFIVRNSKENDLEKLYELSKLVRFINLPQDKNYIQSLIKKSQISFKSENTFNKDAVFLFVLEDLSTKNVIGASLIHSQHGNKEVPHFYFKVEKEHKFSQTLNTGFVHGTLKLGYDIDGPSEIGGLVLHPKFRGHKEKLGKLLSLSRFLYMAIFPKKFKEEIHSELMPPLDENQNSILWEHIGKKFLNMDYHDADKLSRENKEFILNLFPRETIYIPLLPVEVREFIGKVGQDTLPVKKMLEDIGMKYNNEVDPFDGGPHYRGKIKELKTSKNIKKLSLDLSLKTSNLEKYIIVSKFDKEFQSLQSQGQILENKFICKSNSILAPLENKNIYCYSF